MGGHYNPVPSPVVSSIRFPASWHDSAGTFRNEIAEFKLGQGPCGLTVSALSYSVADGTLVIEQRHVEGGPKTFIYPLAQLTGRIEVQKG
jgi:hypothetical protein